MMKIGVISLGCAKNLVDTENLLGLLRAANQEIVTEYDEAEAIIINTCGFIESAKIEAINTILDIEEYRKGNLKKLVVMGCLAQRYKPQLEEDMPEVDRFISIDEYHDLGRILSEVLGIHIPNEYGKKMRVLSGKPWMAYLKIADGCDNRCSYCAIPLIRGPMRSYPIEDLVQEAKHFVEMGVKEINLIAQDCSRYGYDWDKQLHLSELLKELDQIEGIQWIRVLYLYPDEIPDDFIETVKNSKHILPYFDIPVQHGNDRMLKEMHRRGSRETILERTKKIREELKDAVLRTTLITGFPSETLAEHEDTISMLKEVEWDHLGVFAYSSEEDTPAYEMEDDVPKEEKERRRIEILDVQEEITQKRLSSYIGQEAEVLIEGQNALTQMMTGRSILFAPDDIDGYVMVKSDTPCKVGEMVKVRYTKVSGHHMIAEKID